MSRVMVAENDGCAVLCPSPPPPHVPLAVITYSRTTKGVMSSKPKLSWNTEKNAFDTVLKEASVEPYRIYLETDGELGKVFAPLRKGRLW